MQWDRPRPAGVCAVEFAPMTTAKPVILVVEDEALVRMIAVAVAENSGFEVLEAATADEAIKMVAAGRPVRDLHRLSAVGARRADDGQQIGAVGNGGHGKKEPR